MLNWWLWSVSSTMKRNYLWFSNELARGRNVRGTAATATCWSLYLACVSCKFFDCISRRCEPERPPLIWDRSCFSSSWCEYIDALICCRCNAISLRLEGISPVLPPLELQHQDCNSCYLAHGSSFLGGKKIYRETHLCEPKHTLIKGSFAVNLNKCPKNYTG